MSSRFQEVTDMPIVRWLMPCLLLLGAEASAQAVAAQAWIREAPPGARVHAGYVRIVNPTGAAMRLVGASSIRFGAIELHESFERDGMMRMRRREAIEVPPGGDVSLEPGGLHLMLFRASQAVVSGDDIPVDLLFDDGSALTVAFEVRRDAPVQEALSDP